VTARPDGGAGRPRASEIAVAVLLFLLVGGVTALTQPPVTFNSGKGWDGVSYYAMADQFRAGVRPDADAPFVHRPGTPFLASLVPGSDRIAAFRAVNVAGSLLATLLLLYWLSHFLRERWLRLALVALFLIPWHAPARFTFFYPVYTDPWLFVFLLLGWIAIKRYEDDPGPGPLARLGATTAVGVVFRETVLLIPLAFLYSSVRRSLASGDRFAFLQMPVPALAGPRYRRLFIPLLLGLAASFAVHRLTSDRGPYSSAEWALIWGTEKSAVLWLEGIFLAFGPVVVIPVVFWRTLVPFFRENRALAASFFALAALSYFAGSDTERILYWAMPIVCLAIGLSVQERPAVFRSLPLVLLLAVSQGVSQRLFWTTPDYPNDFVTPPPVLTPPTSRCQYFDLYSYHGTVSLQGVSLVQYGALALLIGLWLVKRESSLRALPRPDVSPSDP